MELTDELSRLIEEWTSSNKYATLKRLSELSSIHYNTVCRYAQKDVAEPSLDVAMALVEVLLPREKHGRKGVDLVLKNFPKVGEFIQNLHANNVEVMTEVSTLESFNHADGLVLAIAGSPNGLKAHRAVEKIGKTKAWDSIEKLLAAGVLRQESDTYRTTKAMFRVLGHDKVLRQIMWLCEDFDLKLIDRRGSLYRFISQGLTEEAISRIHTILYNASKEIEEIVSKAENHGDHVMGYGIVSTFIQAEESSR